MRQVVFLALLIATSVAISQTGKVVKIIKGYSLGSFAIKGEIESQLKALVTEIQRNKKENDELHISIIGSADATGNSVTNDRLAKERAEQVKNFLAAHFPEAKITAWSRGDIENVRQVRVEYQFLRAPVVPPKGTPISYFLFAVAGIIVLVATVWKIFAIKTKPTKITPSPKFQWVEVEVGNEIYVVQVEYKDGKYFSPFKTASGSQIIRDNRRGMIDSLRGCLKKVEFAPQKEELIRKGIIKHIFKNVK